MTSREADEIKESIRRLEEKLDHYMIGDAGKDNGILGRVTRLETTEEHRRWHLRALWTAITGVVAKLIVDLFGKSH